MAAPIKKYSFSINLLGNKLLNAKVNEPTDNHEIANKEYVDNLLPIINSLATIDEELPLLKRKPGLTFFVINDTINNGTDLISKGTLYTFENDLTTPLKVSDLSLRYIINQIEIDTTETNYANLLTELNKTYSKPGNIITVQPLNVSFKFDGINWQYFNGEYFVETDLIYDSIPNELKNINSKVYVEDIDSTKIIKSDLTLSDVIIILTEIPIEFENERYYLINDILYYTFDNNLFKLNNKIKFFDIVLNIGDNQIIHNFKSVYIIVKLWININNTENILENNVQLINADFNVIDLNKINLKSSFNNLNVKIMVLSEI